MIERNLLDFATSKNLDGFFETVYTVHPAATVELDVNSRERYGKIVTFLHSQNQIFIEARIGRFWLLRKFSFLNFMLSQVNLIIHLIRLIRRDRNLVIRAEDPRFNGLLGFLLTKVKRLPFVVGTWGNPETIRKLTGKPLQPRVFKNIKMEEFCEKFLLARADCVLVQNEDNFKYATSFGASKERVKYFRLGNAIYPGHFVRPESRKLSLKNQAIIEHAGFKVCTISRLEKLKIVDHAIISFSKMKNSTDSQLYIFGDGSDKDNLMNLTRQLGIDYRVHFLGNVEQQSLAEMLPQMDLILSPSMGRALTEAALAGLPLVAYDTDCHPEIVKTGETGILVKYLDCNAMAQACDYLFDNRTLAKEMGEAARTWTLNFMDPEKLIREQRLIFIELFGSK